MDMLKVSRIYEFISSHMNLNNDLFNMALLKK